MLTRAPSLAAAADDSPARRRGWRRYTRRPVVSSGMSRADPPPQSLTWISNRRQCVGIVVRPVPPRISDPGLRRCKVRRAHCIPGCGHRRQRGRRAGFLAQHPFSYPSYQSRPGSCGIARRSGGPAHDDLHQFGRSRGRGPHRSIRQRAAAPSGHTMRLARGMLIGITQGESSSDGAPGSLSRPDSSTLPRRPARPADPREARAGLCAVSRRCLFLVPI